MLDAQFFGVAQRRERVFLVVNTRDWRRAAPVLFERESLCWDHTSSREKRQSLTQGTAGGVGNADSGIGNLTHGENQSRRVYSSDGIAPTLQARENGGQDQSAVMLDFYQQDGRFKVSEHPDLSNTLTSHMGTGGNNVPLVKALNPTLSTDHNPAVYEVAGNIIGRGQMNGGNQLGVADPDENGAFTLISTDRHAVAEIEREREVMCSADSQSNAARCFNFAPTLMAHAGKDAPFIYPTADGRD